MKNRLLSMKNLYCVILAFLVVSCSGTGDSKGKDSFLNPIIAGYYPDPSICRVGDDYYMVTSSFAYFPGIPLFHSKDLVNWRQIGHVLDRPEQLPLEGLGISRGIFAPAIRYHKGTFYVVSTVVDGGGNFVVTTQDIEGPWSDPVWLPDVEGIDPSLFFDQDGKAYIPFCGDAPDYKPIYDGHRAIWVYEFDYQNLTTVGERKLLVDGGVDITTNPIWVEAPHIFKEGDYYYLICAEGGTGYNHSEVVFRSHRPDGDYVPYEENPILTQRHLDPHRPNPITSTGHADFVQLPCGEWWAVFLGCRPYEPSSEDYYNLGRETFLAPVEWVDGWPIINPDFEEVQYSYPLPNLKPNNIAEFPHSGNFTIKENFNKYPLPPYWVFVRTLREKWYGVNTDEGVLSINLRPETLSGTLNPSFLTRRQQHHFFEASTAMSFTPANHNEWAGMAAFQSQHNYYALVVSQKNGATVAQLLKPNGELDRTMEETGNMEVMAEVNLPEFDSSQEIYLKMEGNGALINFYYSLDNEQWHEVKTNVDAKFLSTRVAGGFVGTTIGMYATSNGVPSNSQAYFNWFNYSGYDPIYSLVP